ncbi:MAG: putative endonuclease [Clostridiales bacterium]|jgi:putative endonuclease|nr:putative endonuclease [Clostridiales bacterium]MDN5282148.1 putative endonuclease [Candidatus Ozemobacter sp.]
MKTEGWFIYILLCNDDTLYTGITNNLAQRIEMHNSGTGAKYTRGRNPVRLIYSESLPNRSEASKRERQIKRLTRKAKLKLAGLESTEPA